MIKSLLLLLYHENIEKQTRLEKKGASKNSDEIIHEKEIEYINEKVLETDRIIKKEFNDDFLIKLQVKESTKGIRPSKKKIKTDCLIRKDSNGEDCFYRGELDLDGNFNGYGELYLKSGKKYEGKFTDGKLNDKGRLIDLFGIKCYEGIFKDNRPMEGFGRIEFTDGSYYIGEVKYFEPHGKGTKYGRYNDVINSGFFFMGEYTEIPDIFGICIVPSKFK